MDTKPLTSEEDDFKRYTPQHPLPEELKKLARDDTVCKYCGVSYLIHNEIKALEDKLKEAEKELVTLRGQKEREAVLRKENEALTSQKQELQTTLESNNTLITSLNNEIEKLKVENKLTQESSTRYKTKYLDTLRQFSKLSQVVRQQKETISQIKEQLCHWKQEMSEFFIQTLQHIADIKETSSKEIAGLESKIQCIDMEKMVLSQSNKTLNDQLKAKDEELKQKLEELQSSIMTKTKLEQNMLDAMTIEKDLEQARNSLKVMEKNLNDSKSQCNVVSVELEQYKIQMKKKTSEIDELTSQQKQAKQEHEMALQKVKLQLQSKEGELMTCLRSLKSLESKFQEQQLKESQITQERNSNISELQELKEALGQAKSDREALKAERELMIQAHQNRIEDLRESFKKKMAEMDNWPKKLQAAVATEKNRHMTEMKTLEENLKHNFVLELQIEKDKYNELLKKYQAQDKDKENLRDNKLSQIEQKYKQEIEDLKRQMTDYKKRATEREEELNTEIETLKKIISELQDRFAKLDNEDSGKVTTLQSELSVAQLELSDNLEKVKVLEEKLKQSKEKVQFLQGVVQRECEERFELTEALSEARKELLSLKMPAGGYGPQRGNSTSSLPSSNSQSTSNTQDEILLKSREQMPTNNISLNYSKNSNNNNSNNNRRNSSGEISGRKSKDAQIMESRKRIANMLGRRS